MGFIEGRFQSHLKLRSFLRYVLPGLMLILGKFIIPPKMSQCLLGNMETEFVHLGKSSCVFSDFAPSLD